MIGITRASTDGLASRAGARASYQKLRESLRPPPGERLRFVCADFSDGLSQFASGSFDHAVSGLSIQYAESYSEAEQCWTSDAYDRLLLDVHRVLKPGARFVFSTNVPEPSWGRVGWNAMRAFWSAKRKLRFLGKLYGMWSYGGWLKREARRGRFHYLPLDVVLEKLARAGFAQVEHRLSFARQAYVFRARRPL